MESEEHARPMTPVHVCWDDNEANIIASILREQGIESQLNSEIPHNVMPLKTAGLGEVRVLVDDENLDKAREIIARYQSDAQSSASSEEP